MSHDDPPDTMRTCEACKGDGCPWCTNGMQNRAQTTQWAKFRQGMQHISNTYSFLQAVVLDLLRRLRNDGSHLAIVMALEGQDLFDQWVSTDPSDGGREAITESLKKFNKQALDYLQAR